MRKQARRFSRTKEKAIFIQSSRSIQLILAAILAYLVLPLPWAFAAGKIQHPEIKGEDDRLIVDALEYPWSAIGRVNMAGLGFCTGVMVGPRTVLTAAHCVYNKKTRRFFQAQSLTFVASYQRGDYLAYSKATKIQRAPAYNYKLENGYEKSKDDWALLTLEKPLGAITGYLGATNLSPVILAHLKKEKTVFVQGGYSKDRQHIISAHINCPIDGFIRETPVLIHFCDAISGDSGSPLFTYINGSFSILAMHSATGTNEKFVFGIAVPSKNFIHALNKGKDFPGRAPWRRPAKATKTIKQVLKLLPPDRREGRHKKLGPLIQKLPAKKTPKLD